MLFLVITSLFYREPTGEVEEEEGEVEVGEVKSKKVYTAHFPEEVSYHLCLTIIEWEYYRLTVCVHRRSS